MLKAPDCRGLAIAVFFCFVQMAFAQIEVTVDGTVKDAKGQPVTGAYVLEKGTLNGVLTDLDGNYKLTVPANAIITVENLGFTTIEFKADESGTHNVVLE